MSERIFTLFGEEIFPEPQKTAGKGRGKKKDDDNKDAEPEAIQAQPEEAASPAEEVIKEEAGAIPETNEAIVIPAEPEVKQPEAIAPEVKEEIPAPAQPKEVSNETEAALLQPEATGSMAEKEPEAIAIAKKEEQPQETGNGQGENRAETGKEPEIISAQKPEAEAAETAKKPEVTGSKPEAPAAKKEPKETKPKSILTRDLTLSDEEPEDTMPDPLSSEKPEAETTTEKKPKVKRELKAAVLPEDWKGEEKYYTIGQVADLFKVKTSHIRFWTTEFRMKVRTTRKGDRLYNEEQVKELRAIHHLVKERGFTLTGARAKMKAEKNRDVETVDLKQSLLQLRSKLMIIKNQLK